MLKQLFEYIRRLALLKAQTEQNTNEIKEIRQELKELTLVVQRLSIEFEHL